MAQPKTAFDSYSPLAYRYYDEETAKHLSPRAFLKRELEVEVALIKTLHARGLCPAKAVEEVEAAAKVVQCEDVEAQEVIVQHDIRAMVNCLRAVVSDETKPYIHLGATSYDIIDTANATMYKWAAIELVHDRLMAIAHTLADIAEREADTIQIGRTHGQHAVPMTFGLAMALHASRIASCCDVIWHFAGELRGKFSGAVGAYNALSLLVADPEEFEREVLKLLHLKPAEVSSQIAPPEPLTRLAGEIVIACGATANIAEDLRHLRRSEIKEIDEKIDPKRVGSSTMPHKRNPIAFENVCSLWLEVKERYGTVLSNLVSEHQRDLTNSASRRFLTELFAIAAEMARRLDGALKKMTVNREQMLRNVTGADGVAQEGMAEALYIALAAAGHPDAHECVRLLAAKGGSLMPLAVKDESLKPYLSKFTEQQRAAINIPVLYTGVSAAKARAIAIAVREKFAW